MVSDKQLLAAISGQNHSKTKKTHRLNHAVNILVHQRQQQQHTTRLHHQQEWLNTTNVIVLNVRLNVSNQSRDLCMTFMTCYTPDTFLNKREGWTVIFQEDTNAKSTSMASPVYKLFMDNLDMMADQDHHGVYIQVRHGSIWVWDNVWILENKRVSGQHMPYTELKINTWHCKEWRCTSSWYWLEIVGHFLLTVRMRKDLSYFPSNRWRDESGCCVLLLWIQCTTRSGCWWMVD